MRFRFKCTDFNHGVRLPIRLVYQTSMEIGIKIVNTWGTAALDGMMTASDLGCPEGEALTLQRESP